MSDYEDILHLSRPVSPRHAKMSLMGRAAQFSSFAALTGYEDVIKETGRLTDRCSELDESTIENLDRQLHSLSARIQCYPAVSVTYFLPDKRKEGGSYQTKTGRLKAIDLISHLLLFDDRTEIPINSIIQIAEN